METRLPCPNEKCVNEERSACYSCGWWEGRQVGLKEEVELAGDIAEHILQDGSGNWSVVSWRLKEWFSKRQAKGKIDAN